MSTKLSVDPAASTVTRAPRWRIGVGVVAVALAGFAAMVTYGLTVEYGGSFWPAEALMLVGIPAVVAALALSVLPLRGRFRGGVMVGFVAVTIGAVYAGNLLGERVHGADPGVASSP